MFASHKISNYKEGRYEGWYLGTQDNSSHFEITTTTVLQSQWIKMSVYEHETKVAMHVLFLWLQLYKFVFVLKIYCGFAT